jgi:hypothetical protein
MRKLVVAAALVGFAALGATALGHARSAASSQITVCVESDGGGLYVADSCPGRTLTWNKEASAGPTGPPGPQGVAGPAGPQGAQGPPGPSGASSARPRLTVVVQRVDVRDDQNGVASCPGVSSAIGGGAVVEDGLSTYLYSPQNSFPVVSPSGRSIGWAFRPREVYRFPHRVGPKRIWTAEWDGIPSHRHKVEIPSFVFPLGDSHAAGPARVTVYAICITDLKVTTPVRRANPKHR